MGTEEQDQIHGRLMREHRESLDRMAAISSKLKQSSANLRDIASSLDEVARPGRREPPDAARRLAAGIPSSSALLEIIDQAEEERRTLRDIEQQLERFRRE